MEILVTGIHLSPVPQRRRSYGHLLTWTKATYQGYP